MTMARIELDKMTTDVLDQIRGDVPRMMFVSDMIHRVSDGDLIEIGTVSDAAELILDEAVGRATRAFRDHRPGYGEFILTRAALAITNVEELRHESAMTC